MTEKELTRFCIENAILLTIIYTVFIILLVSWLVNRINKIKDMFTNMMLDIQNAYRTYNHDLEDRDKVSYQLSKNTKKVVNDITYISKVLEQYKGQIFDTKLNNQISNQIIQEMNSNSSNTKIQCDDTTRIKTNPKLNNINTNIKKDKLISLSDLCLDDNDNFSDEFSLSKIGEEKDNNYIRVSDLTSLVKKNNAKNEPSYNKYECYSMDKPYIPH